ncbi:MAG: cupredoxin domain-containing protein [Betaproteobacteria bacterium]
MKLAIIVVLAVAVVLFAGIASANTAQVLIKDFKFQPDQITIQKGDTITWTHPGTASHTVKFADSESQILKNGGTYSKTFDQAGTFPYSCGIHPYMTGTVIVQ